MPTTRSRQNRRMAIATAPTDVSNAEHIRWAFDDLNRHDAASLEQQ
jgi:hypothetical protein